MVSFRFQPVSGVVLNELSVVSGRCSGHMGASTGH